MIVCSCNNIREKDLREAARNGAERPHQAYAACGGKVQCGQCLPFAREILSQERRKLQEIAASPCANGNGADILPFPQERRMRA